MYFIYHFNLNRVDLNVSHAEFWQDDLEMQVPRYFVPIR